jgi:hypothetical protein
MRLKLSQMQMAMDEQRSQLQDKRTMSDLYRNNIDANGNINAAGITQRTRGVLAWAIASQSFRPSKRTTAKRLPA